MMYILLLEDNFEGNGTARDEIWQSRMREVRY